MESSLKHIDYKVYILSFLFLTVFGFVFYNIFSLLSFEREHYVELAKKMTVIRKDLVPEKGNIYADNNALLATNLTNYSLFFDSTIPSDKMWKDGLGELTKGLSAILGSKSPSEYRKLFSSLRKNNNRYFKICSNIDFLTYKKIKELPIFKERRVRGGLIIEKNIKRVKPFGDIGSRLIGYSTARGNVGIEGGYHNIVNGVYGNQLHKKLKSGAFKPLPDDNRKDPIDGKDIVTSLDMNIQRFAYQRLRETLFEFKADHGCVVVMEVETGKVKAMVNLSSTNEGNYTSQRNYAVYESQEPGSTFKLASYLAAFEDGYIDTASVVNVGNGTLTINKKRIVDSHFEKSDLSIKQAFAHSSNVAVAKTIHMNYKNNPTKFVKRLNNIGFGRQLEVPIPGEGKSYLPHPKDEKWSALSLPWMAYGYGLSVTPLQMLSFYNGIANRGKMVKPQFVNSILDAGNEEQLIEKEVLNPSMCSENTLQSLYAILKGVTAYGTAKSVFKDSRIKVMGKTGTTQLNYWRSGRQKDYVASFVGFFPAQKPKYSCIVVVNKPKKEIGYSGAGVAAPVFRDIVEYMTPYLDGVEYKLGEDKIENISSKIANSKTELVIEGDYVPNFTGLSGGKAISIAENLGLRVTIKGSGKVVAQSVPNGKTIQSAKHVKLFLE